MTPEMRKQLAKVWKEFAISGDPERLAMYVEHGGELTNVTRKLIAKWIRKGGVSAERETWLANLWEEYVISGEPERFATYIKHGGELTAEDRERIAKWITDGAPKTKPSRHKADRLRDLQVYQEVVAWRVW